MPQVASRIRLYRSATDYITFDYAGAAPRYSPQGERITDRLGLVHRIAPDCPRHPTGLALTLIPEELTRTNCPAADPRLCAIDWLERAFRQQERLSVFCAGETVAEGGMAVARRLAWLGYIDELPGDGFGALPPVGPDPEQALLGLTIVADGSFSDFDDMDSAVYTPR